VEQDSGNPPELTLIRTDGSIVKRVKVTGAQNRDWEDMAIGAGPDPSVNYIYVADIGDNSLQYSSYTIYRFPEPRFTKDSAQAETINFKYPDGAHDAEAIFVDDASKDIYVVTKWEARSKVYRLSYPQSINTINNATFVTELGFAGAVGAAFSPDGKDLIIRTYHEFYWWNRHTGESIVDMLKRPQTNAGYSIEPQGESISFKDDNSGFFTLSERSYAASVSLNFYKRL